MIQVKKRNAYVTGGIVFRIIGREMARNQNGNQGKKEMKKERKAAKIQKKLQKKLQKKEKKIVRKAENRERRKRWKEAKKVKRAALKERYKDAPWIIRIPRVYLLKPFIFGIIGLTAFIFLAGFGIGTAILIYRLSVDAMYEDRNKPVDKEKIYELAPIDEEGAAKIDAYAPIGKDETWAFYVYMVGADLEDMDENDLSITASLQTKQEKEARNQASKDHLYENLNRYSDELEKNGLALPEFLYFPDRPVASEQTLTQKVVVADEPGMASSDLEEMISTDLSDNITIIVQTGGATRWSNSMVNPNRTQRFIINSEECRELDSFPLQCAVSPDTLADFLIYCRDNHPADHTMLILWDHGSGPFGYGSDSIFGGDSMSLKEIRTALSKAYNPNAADRAFDIIGFDACLMSSLEVTHALDGFADYYVLSAETEPGEGWDYTGFLNNMCADATLSAAAVGRSIADTYMDYYMTQNVNIGKIRTVDLSFALLDARKASELYDAYCDLTKVQLKDSAKDIGVLAEIGRCSGQSTHYAAYAYNERNLTDLGNYVSCMADTYPEECSRIDALLDEAVLYHRENGSLSDSEGISVYVPGFIDSYYGLYYFLNYVYDICEDDNTRALYYYKMAGCLNDEMLEDVGKITDVKPVNLDTSLFRKFDESEVTIENGCYSVPVSEKLQNMIQDYSFTLALYDENLARITYYGEDDDVDMDEEGNIVCDFSGKWICFDSEPLNTEITSCTPSSIEYRSRVMWNGVKSYLVFSLNRDTGEYSIKGIREIPDPEEDGINYMINTKSNKELKQGDKIVPIYDETNLLTGEVNETEGKTIYYATSTEIKRKSLPGGDYLGMTTIFDQRGDEYYSQVVEYTISGGKVKNTEVNHDFYGSAY